MSTTATVWLPTDPPRQAPQVLDDAETAILLRLDKTGVKNTAKTLEYYRREMGLPARIVGKQMVYLLDEVLEWVRNHAKRGVDTNGTPAKKK